MPKFSEKEKEIIQDKLRSEGEKLFTAHGLKKVTVDDLVNAASISKGSFYAFYENKEHLYMELNNMLQQDIYMQIDIILSENIELKPRDITKIVIKFLLDSFLKYPIIASINAEMWEYLVRRLPQHMIERNNVQDNNALQKLLDHGIQIKCPITVATKVLQAVFVAASQFQADDQGEDIIEILISGIVEQLVAE